MPTPAKPSGAAAEAARARSKRSRRVNGASQQVGGTSLAAPLFTAAWARIESSHNNSLGFAAPLIYAAYARSRTPFHDITSGSNGSYTGHAGYDYPTGLGSFDIQLLNAGL